MTILEFQKAVSDAIVKLKQEKTEEKRKQTKARDIKYPYQVVSVKRPKKVLGADARLSVPVENNSPLELHSGFSRFVLTIVDKDADATPTANIPADEISYIMEMTRMALDYMSRPKKVVASGNESTSPAYTQKLFSNTYKGMTPAEVLLKDPSQEGGLIKTRDWLQSNVTKYPANQSQIDAINDAVKLLKEGKLKAEDSMPKPPSVIEIYKTDYKFKTKKNEKGYHLIYGIEIFCDTSKNYPFVVNIMNCYAPVETSPTGQKSVKMNQAENTVRSSLSMDKQEWFNFIEKLNRVRNMFEQSHFTGLLEESEIAGEY